jgi:hypothetical protein
MLPETRKINDKSEPGEAVLQPPGGVTRQPATDDNKQRGTMNLRPVTWRADGWHCFSLFGAEELSLSSRDK